MNGGAGDWDRCALRFLGDGVELCAGVRGLPLRTVLENVIAREKPRKGPLNCQAERPFLGIHQHTQENRSVSHDSHYH